MAYGTVGSPGNSPYVITVGATDSHETVLRSDDTVASFSSKGPTRFDHLVKPDIVAPGRRIVAAMSQEANTTLANEYPAQHGAAGFFELPPSTFTSTIPELLSRRPLSQALSR